MSALDAKIDELYRLPLNEFTGARNALAKSLSKEEAKQVKALEKPTVVPWAVNQVYWRARSTYDRLMKSGEKLRAAQIAALEGKHADVRGAGEAHRRAIGEAVAEAERLSAASGAKPGADALARTFESLSLATSTTSKPGRLVEALQPAGFEALAGITPTAAPANSELRTRNFELKTANAERRTKNDDAAARREAARLEAERKKHEAAVKAAEAEVERAQEIEQAARKKWEQAHDDLLAARQALTDVRKARFTRPT